MVLGVPILKYNRVDQTVTLLANGEGKLVVLLLYRCFMSTVNTYSPVGTVSKPNYPKVLKY